MARRVRIVFRVGELDIVKSVVKRFGWWFDLDLVQGAEI